MDFSQVVTPDEAHQMVNEGNWMQFETFDEIEVAKTFRDALEKSISGRKAQLYTQVDADEDVVYDKGVHFVNRTGVYLVAWI